METQEEYQVQQMIKGKRTKRQRPPSPFGIHMVSGSSGSGGYDQSPTTSAGGVTGSSTEEEEDQDLANCLILLAQGRYERSSCPVVAEKIITTTNTVTATAESLYVYQCKTCDRCFPSFQALGGHRASHKKPKNNMNYGEGNDGQFRNVTSTILSLQMSSSRPPATVAVAGNVKAKVHECLICRAEFSSGQALGGHMRRHRTITTTTAVAVADGGGTTSGLELKKLVIKKERNVLELDLNLPAPEDDRHRAVAAVFSASPLVDCHY